MKTISFCTIAALTLTVFACTKNFEEANTNPNAPEVVPATNLLLSGITSGIFGVVTDRYGTSQSFENTLGNCGHWVQYYSGLQFPAIDQYIVDPTGFVYLWGTYFNALKDLQTIIDNPENGDNMVAAAMVMRAFLYNQMVDLLGDIPYTQALNVEAFVQPMYDTQEHIYRDLSAQLMLAAAKFDASKDPLGLGDVLYNGDVEQWKKFANSLRARLLNHYKHLDAQANNDLVQMLNNPADFPVFENNGDNAQLTPTHSFPYRNTMLDITLNGALSINDCTSSTLVNTLKDLNDPRLPVYAQLNNQGEYKGKPPGSAPAVSLTDYSDIGKIFREDFDFPASAMTCAELLFIKAEVLNDKQAYSDGINAAMNAYGLTPNASYMTAASAAFETEGLKAIITQKWLALFGRNSIEAFTEFRRTGFPASIQEAANSRYPGLGIPHRFNYPNNEEATNGANLRAARDRQHIDQSAYLFGDKMWWAK